MQEFHDNHGSISNLYGELFFTFNFYIMAVCALLTSKLKFLSIIANHGKQLNSLITISLESFMYVPKEYFKHFYILGLFSDCVALIMIIGSKKDYCMKFYIYCSLCLFAIHCSIRLYECYFITVYNESKMHMFGYLCGLWHYLVIPLSMLPVSTCLNANTWYSNTFYKLLNNLFYLFIVLSIFVFASYYQWECHYILYQLKLSRLENIKSNP